MIALENYVMWCLIKDEYIRLIMWRLAPIYFQMSLVSIFVRTVSFLRQSAMCRWINCLAFRGQSVCPPS